MNIYRIGDYSINVERIEYIVKRQDDYLLVMPDLKLPIREYDARKLGVKREYEKVKKYETEEDI